MARSGLRPIDQFIADAAAGTMTRRELVTRGAALELSASALGMALRATPEAAFAQGAEPTGQIVISLSAEPATLENWNAYSLDGHPVLRNIFEALLNRDPATNEGSSASWPPPGSGPTTAPFASPCARVAVTFQRWLPVQRAGRRRRSSISPGPRRMPSTSRSSWGLRSARRSSMR